MYLSYDKDKFLEKFSKTDIYKKLVTDYKYLYSDMHDIDVEYQPIQPGCEHRSNLKDSSIFVYSSFYYLDFLLAKNPNNIADIGCGANIYKSYIPGIIGFDDTNSADIAELFDDNFIKNHYQEFDCAFAINSIHFISPDQFLNRIHELGKVIRPGGRGCIIFNMQVMVNRSSAEFKRKSIDEVVDYFKQELKNCQFDILVADFLVTRENRISAARYAECAGSSWPSYTAYLNKNFTGIDDAIVKEIQDLVGTNVDPLNDPLNGNIRIVFNV